MRIIRSFGYALSGISNALKNETNFRVHTVAAVSVLWFARVYGADKTELALVCAVICLVMVGELLNTAVEAMVDIISPERCRLAKIAKDSAAGAVLVMAAGAVAVAFLLFSDAEKLRGVLEYVSEHHLIIILYIVICAVYIFMPRNLVKKERKN